jgi:hypothetical protein
MPQRFRFLSAFTPFLFVLLFTACQSKPADYHAIDDLPNPGRGWATFNSFDGEAVNAEYPASTIAYYRFTWRQAEPSEGGYAFGELDALIEKARSAGQRLAFRIMADAGSDGAGVPDWLRAKGIAGWRYRCQDGADCFSPDAADPVFMEYARRLIAAFGARYNDHPDIDHVDIGLVGDYGEWHVTSAASLGGSMPSTAIRRQYIDWHLEAFPDTPLLMPVGNLTLEDADTLAYALSRGTGYRADCWGDFRSPYNHMEDDYPMKISKTPGLVSAWRTAPVALETCGVPSDWYTYWPGKLDAIVKFAIENHVSILNAKSSEIPAAWVGKFAEFTRHIGYRFALDSPAEMPASAARGSMISIRLTWTNRGNAPVYRPYKLAVRLVSGGNEIARTVSDVDVCTWMPFSADGLNYTATISVEVPPDSTAGTADVQVVLLDPFTKKPAIRFDMPGGNPDLWYDIGTMEVE